MVSQSSLNPVRHVLEGLSEGRGRQVPRGGLPGIDMSPQSCIKGPALLEPKEKDDEGSFCRYPNKEEDVLELIA
jgi:hypothetical protein